MFVAVGFSQGGGLLRRRAEVRRCVFCGREYYHIIQPLQAGKSPRWKEIANIAGRARSKLVLPRGVEPPSGYGLRRLPLEDFFGRLALASARALLASLGGVSEPVGVLDAEGVFCRRSLELLELCPALKVYTQRPERYLALAARCAAPVVLVSSPRELSGCLLAVSPGRCGRLEAPVPLLCARDSRAVGRPTVGCLSLALPPAARCIVPEGVEPEDFFGAMELCCAGGLPFPLLAGECRVDGRLTELSAESVLNPFSVSSQFDT